MCVLLPTVLFYYFTVIVFFIIFHSFLRRVKLSWFVRCTVRAGSFEQLDGVTVYTNHTETTRTPFSKSPKKKLDLRCVFHQAPLYVGVCRGEKYASNPLKRVTHISFMIDFSDTRCPAKPLPNTPRRTMVRHLLAAWCQRGRTMVRPVSAVWCQHGIIWHGSARRPATTPCGRCTACTALCGSRSSSWPVNILVLTPAA